MTPKEKEANKIVDEARKIIDNNKAATESAHISFTQKESKKEEKKESEHGEKKETKHEK